MADVQRTVEKWDIFEIACEGISGGNPFTERKITGYFEGKQEKVSVDGFYDGDGIYRVRFMPSFEGDIPTGSRGTLEGRPGRAALP